MSRAPHARKTHPLPPGMLFFAECHHRALGISLLCRVPTQGHSANLVTCRARARYRGRVVTAIIVCRVPNRCTRQTWSRAAQAPVAVGGPSRSFLFAECQKSGTRQKSDLPSAIACALGIQVCLPSVLFSTRQNNKKISPMQSKLFS